MNGKWDPSCSFCGSHREEELIRAGARDHWICGRCVEQPAVAQSIGANARCTFCEELIGHNRPVAAANSGAIICTDCLKICVQILEEDRQFKARRKA